MVWFRTALRIIVALATSVTAITAAHAQPMGPGAVEEPILAGDPALRASLERIAAGSTSWREAVDAIRGTGRHVFVLTPEQVVVVDTPDGEGAGPFDPAVLAEVAPVADERGRVRTVLVVVNLPLIERVHGRRGSLPGEVAADLDRIVVHEVYGHALPYLHAGHLSGRCPDPEPHERAGDACAIRRENAVRKELKLGRRTDYGLKGLTLASLLP